MQPAALQRTIAGLRCRMGGYTIREKLKITAGAISALVIVTWLAVLTIAFLAA